MERINTILPNVLSHLANENFDVLLTEKYKKEIKYKRKVENIEQTSTQTHKNGSNFNEVM